MTRRPGASPTGRAAYVWSMSPAKTRWNGPMNLFAVDQSRIAKITWLPEGFHCLHSPCILIIPMAPCRSVRELYLTTMKKQLK